MIVFGVNEGISESYIAKALQITIHYVKKAFLTAIKLFKALFSLFLINYSPLNKKIYIVYFNKTKTGVESDNG